MVDNYDRVMRELNAIRTQLRGAISFPQLAYASFDSGAGHSIDEYNPDTKQPVASFGTQFDGSHGSVVFSGPVPPTPTKPLFEVAPGVISGGWDGYFVNDAGNKDETIPPTLDWTHAEVHAAPTAGDTAETAETIIGTINTPRGGMTTVAISAGTWYLRLVSRSAAGKRSAASEPVAVVVPDLVDTSGLEADLAEANTRITNAATAAATAIEAAETALGSAESAEAQALSALGQAETAQSTATTAQGAAATAQGAAATAQSTATTAQGAAATAQGAAETAAANAGTALSEAAKANKKITVSTAVPSGTGNPGDIWYRKNGTTATAAIIGMWEWATAPTPAGWKVRTHDGGIVSNMSIVNLVAGTGTMATGVIDKIFADVVVAKTSVTATAFIGADAILTGAITAPKITASVELSAKVASFLTVTADMIETNELWADEAWITAARTHVLTVLSNTNGQGYTSTVTGQGLKVTRTVGGNTIDVIRLGTFGEDLLAISDGNGQAVAAISGVGDVGAKQLYSQGDVYANGRRLEAASDGPRGEVAFAQHTYPAGGFVTNATTGHTGAGVIDLQFTAERGRAYRLFGSLRTILRNSTLERMAIAAVYRIGGLMPTITTFDGRIISPSNGYYETGDMTRTGWGQTDNFSGRFVPMPFNYAGAGQTTTCRILIFIRRLIGPVGTQLEVENIEASVIDLGVPTGSLYGQNAGAGTSTMPAVTQIDQTRAVDALRVFRRTAGSTGNWTYDSTITDRVMAGRFNGYDYISFLNMINLNTDAVNALNLDIQELSLTMTPNLFTGGMGAVVFQVASNYAATSTTITNAVLPSEIYPATEQRVGAWPVNTSRTLHFPPAARDMFRTAGRMIAFGASIPQADRGNPQYQVQIPVASISGRFRASRKAS